jgi:hypothetical protein
MQCGTLASGHLHFTGCHARVFSLEDCVTSGLHDARNGATPTSAVSYGRRMTHGNDKSWLLIAG